MSAYLDNLPRGTVVYARNFNTGWGITTTARYDGAVERIEIHPETGAERVVKDYFLWNLRTNKEMINPAAVWRTAQEYQQLRSGGKIKLFGDFDESNPNKSGKTGKKKTNTKNS